MFPKYGMFLFLVKMINALRNVSFLKGTGEGKKPSKRQQQQ